jgi:hypothetical protein
LPRPTPLPAGNRDLRIATLKALGLDVSHAKEQLLPVDALLQVCVRVCVCGGGGQRGGTSSLRGAQFRLLCCWVGLVGTCATAAVNMSACRLLQPQPLSATATCAWGPHTPCECCCLLTPRPLPPSSPLHPPHRLIPQVLCQAFGVAHACLTLHTDRTAFVFDSAGGGQENPWGITTCPWVQLAPHPTPLVCRDLRVRHSGGWLGLGCGVWGAGVVCVCGGGGEEVQGSSARTSAAYPCHWVPAR